MNTNCFLAKSTYLERENPRLFKKIADYLMGETTQKRSEP